MKQVTRPQSAPARRGSPSWAQAALACRESSPGSRPQSATSCREKAEVNPPRVRWSDDVFHSAHVEALKEEALCVVERDALTERKRGEQKRLVEEWTQSSRERDQRWQRRWRASPFAKNLYAKIERAKGIHQELELSKRHRKQEDKAALRSKASTADDLEALEMERLHLIEEIRHVNALQQAVETAEKIHAARSNKKLAELERLQNRRSPTALGDASPKNGADVEAKIEVDACQQLQTGVRERIGDLLQLPLEPLPQPKIHRPLEHWRKSRSNSRPQSAKSGGSRPSSACGSRSVGVQVGSEPHGGQSFHGDRRNPLVNSEGLGGGGHTPAKEADCSAWAEPVVSSLPLQASPPTSATAFAGARCGRTRLRTSAVQFVDRCKVSDVHGDDTSGTLWHADDASDREFNSAVALLVNSIDLVDGHVGTTGQIKVDVTSASDALALATTNNTDARESWDATFLHERVLDIMKIHRPRRVISWPEKRAPDLAASRLRAWESLGSEATVLHRQVEDVRDIEAKEVKPQRADHKEEELIDSMRSVLVEGSRNGRLDSVVQQLQAGVIQDYGPAGVCPASAIERTELGIDELRKLAFETFGRASTDGRLTQVFEEAMSRGRVSDDGLRKTALETFGNARDVVHDDTNDIDGLSTRRCMDDIDRLHKLAHETLGQVAEDDSLTQKLEEGLHHDAKDIDVHRALALEMLGKPSVEGRLTQLLENGTSRGTQESDAFRKLRLEEGLHDGTTDIDELRTLAFETLGIASMGGRLPQLLEKAMRRGAQNIDELRTLVPKTLAYTSEDDMLTKGKKDALHDDVHDIDGLHELVKTQQASHLEGGIRDYMMCVLVEALQSGRLANAVEDMKTQQASHLEDEIRGYMRSSLVGAFESGRLAHVLQQTQGALDIVMLQEQACEEPGAVKRLQDGPQRFCPGVRKPIAEEVLMACDREDVSMESLRLSAQSALEFASLTAQSALEVDSPGGFDSSLGDGDVELKIAAQEAMGDVSLSSENGIGMMTSKAQRELEGAWLPKDEGGKNITVARKRLTAELEARKQAEVRATENAAAEERMNAEAEAGVRAEAEAWAKIAEAAKVMAAAEARANATEEARVKAEVEARVQVEVETRVILEMEARAKTAEEARAKASEEASVNAKAVARSSAEAEARANVAEEARVKAEAEARANATEELRANAEVEVAAAHVVVARAIGRVTAKMAEAMRAKAESEARAEEAEKARVRIKRAKAEAEARVFAEAEAGQKAAEEAKVKAWAEARSNAAAGLGVKLAAEGMVNAEREASTNAKEEARAIFEAEARAKVVKEVRAKAELHAAATRSVVAWAVGRVATKAAEEKRLYTEAEANVRAEVEAEAMTMAAKASTATVETEALAKAVSEARVTAVTEMRIKSEAGAWMIVNAEAEANIVKAEAVARVTAAEAVRCTVETEGRTIAAKAVAVTVETEAMEKAESEALDAAVEEMRVKAEADVRMSLKIQIEANVNAEIEARANAAEAARCKAVTEARAIAAEALTATGETEVMLRAESEARRIAVEETRVQYEADLWMRLKAEADAKVRAEAEAMTKATESVRFKVVNEARTMAAKAMTVTAETEAMAKAVSEARVTAVEATMVKYEADSRMRSAAETEARANATESVRFKAEAEARAMEAKIVTVTAVTEAMAKAESKARVNALEEIRAKYKSDVWMKAITEILTELRWKATEEATMRTELEAWRIAGEQAKAAAKEKAAVGVMLECETEARVQAETEARANAAEEARLAAEGEVRAKVSTEVATEARIKEALLTGHSRIMEAQATAAKEVRTKFEEEQRLRLEREAKSNAAAAALEARINEAHAMAKEAVKARLAEEARLFEEVRGLPLPSQREEKLVTNVPENAKIKAEVGTSAHESTSSTVVGAGQPEGDKKTMSVSLAGSPARRSDAVARHFSIISGRLGERIAATRGISKALSEPAICTNESVSAVDRPAAQSSHRKLDEEPTPEIMTPTAPTTPMTPRTPRTPRTPTTNDAKERIRPTIGDTITVLDTKNTRTYGPELIGNAYVIKIDAKDGQPYQVEGSLCWLLEDDVLLTKEAEKEPRSHMQGNAKAKPEEDTQARILGQEDKWEFNRKAEKGVHSQMQVIAQVNPEEDTRNKILDQKREREINRKAEKAIQGGTLETAARGSRKESSREALYMPIMIQGRVIAVSVGNGKWQLTNKFLRASNKAVYYRNSKEMSDKHPTKFLTWGSVFEVVDVDDRWLTCTVEATDIDSAMEEEESAFEDSSSKEDEDSVSEASSVLSQPF